MPTRDAAALLEAATRGAAPDDATVARAGALLVAGDDAPELWDALAAALAWALALERRD